MSTADPLDLTALYDGLISHQKASGFFDVVLAHEPMAPLPEQGVTAATFLQRVAPVARTSGLAATSCRVEAVTRIHNPRIMVDQDAMDPRVYRGSMLLLQAYTGDFTLGGSIDQLDLMGAYGEPLHSRAGYLRIGQQLLRVMDVVTPLIIHDVFPQTP